MKCSLCLSDQTFKFSHALGRDYYRCTHCELIFQDIETLPTFEEQKRHYDHHENDELNYDYLKFLNRLAQPMLTHLSEGSSGLDFGCGRSIALSRIFQQSGHKTNHYDPIYYPDQSVFNEKYDFVAASEVVEHFHNPHLEFENLFNLLKRNAILGIMTDIYQEQDFSHWYYKNDPTHVVFYSPETFQFIANKYGNELVFVSEKIVIVKSM